VDTYTEYQLVEYNPGIIESSDESIELVCQIRDENYEKTKKMSQNEQFAIVKKRSAFPVCFS